MWIFCETHGGEEEGVDIVRDTLTQGGEEGGMDIVRDTG